jgi:predicted RNase H-like nuclease (RuvC/YqgF family)
MTAVEINEAVAKLRQREATWEAERAGHKETLARALAAEPRRYNEHVVREARRQKERLEQQLTELNEQVGALEAQLPSADEIGKADADARALVTQIQAAHERFTDQSARLREAAERAESVGREFLETRRSSVVLTARLKNVVREYALAVQMPEAADLDSADANIVYLVGVYLSEIAYGEPTKTGLRDLIRARAEQNRAGEPAIASVAP